MRGKEGGGAGKGGEGGGVGGEKEEGVKGEKEGGGGAASPGRGGARWEKGVGGEGGGRVRGTLLCSCKKSATCANPVLEEKGKKERT